MIDAPDGLQMDPGYPPHRQKREDERDDWRTPDHIWNTLDDRFNFTGDACAGGENALAIRYFTPEGHVYLPQPPNRLNNTAPREAKRTAMPGGALTMGWDSLGGSVFMNPPYSATKDFVKRALGQVRLRKTNGVVCLVPATTDVKWFHEVSRSASEIWFYEGRISFIHPDSEEPRNGNPVGSMLLVFQYGKFGKTRLGSISSKTGLPAGERDLHYWIQHSETSPRQLRIVD